MESIILVIMIAGGVVMLFTMLKEQIGYRPENGNDDDELVERIGDGQFVCENWFYFRRSGFQD